MLSPHAGHCGAPTTWEATSQCVLHFAANDALQVPICTQLLSSHPPPMEQLSSSWLVASYATHESAEATPEGTSKPGANT